jgi:hypothetical protein
MQQSLLNNMPQGLQLFVDGRACNPFLASWVYSKSEKENGIEHLFIFHWNINGKSQLIKTYLHQSYEDYFTLTLKSDELFALDEEAQISHLPFLLHRIANLFHKPITIHLANFKMEVICYPLHFTQNKYKPFFQPDWDYEGEDISNKISCFNKTIIDYINSNPYEKSSTNWSGSPES